MRRGEVCGERYTGNHHWPNQFTNWETEPCEWGVPAGRLVTVIATRVSQQQVARLERSLAAAWPGALLLLEEPGQEESLVRLAGRVSTPYTLLAGDTEWAGG